MKKLLLPLIFLAVPAFVVSCADSHSAPSDPEEVASGNIAAELREKVAHSDSFICDGVGELDTVTLREELQSQIEGLKYDISLNHSYVETMEKAIKRKAPGFREMKDRENRRVQHKIDSLNQLLEETSADEVVYIRTRYYYRCENRKGQMVKDSTWVLLNPDLSVKLVMN